MSGARIEVIERNCKACCICAEFCPKDVLEMDVFVVKVPRPEDCIKCMQCELLCPDFAIKVHDE